MNVNRIFLIGNIGNDPELRQTKRGIDVTNFSVATTERKKGTTEPTKSITQWHKVVCWDEVARYTASNIVKGNLVFIEGSLVYNTREDLNGNKKYIAEVKALRVKNLTRKNDTDNKNIVSVLTKIFELIEKNKSEEYHDQILVMITETIGVNLEQTMATPVPIPVQ